MHFEVFSKLRLVERMFMNQYNTELLPYGFTVGHWGLLRYLVTKGEATFAEAAAVLHVENPTLTPIAQKLVEKQLIEIVTGADRRQKVMRVSELGKAKYDQIYPVALSLLTELLEGISEEHQQIFLQSLEQVYSNIVKK